MKIPSPSPIRSLAPLLGSIALLLPGISPAADFQKASNTTSLNLIGSWTVTSGADGDGIPDADDRLIWNSVVTASNISMIGADLSVLGIQVTNVGGTRNTVANYAGISNTTGQTHTLTIGTGGIDLSTALQPLRIDTRVTLSGSQTWNIADATTAGAGYAKGEDLLFFAQAAAVPMNLGGFTVSKTGVGTVAIGTGYTISNGTLNVDAGILQIQSGSSRVMTINSDVTMNVASGASLRIACESGAGGVGINAAGAITLNTGSTFLQQLNQNNAMNLTGNINVAGNTTWLVQGAAAYTTALATFSGNLTGSGNIDYQNTAPVAATTALMRFTGNNNGYTGTLTLNGGSNNRSLRLSGANAGSANATWSVAAANVLQIDGVGVSLGTLTGAGTVTNSHASNAATISVGAGNFSGVISNGTPTMALTKVGAGTLTLSGANTYTGATTVSNGTLFVGPGVLGGTAVSVANGATLGVQQSASGSLAVTSVSLADGGTLLARPLAAGTSTTIPLLTAGTATGGTVTLDTGLLGNPTATPLTATTFNPVAGTKIKVLGSNLSVGTFPGVAYTTLGGGGFAGLSLALPFRVGGSLVNNAGSVDVNITGTVKPVWAGGVNGNWNIDTVGDGSTGTANWAVAAGPNTYVESVTLGNDSVVFDNTGAARPNVTLATVLTPGGITANHSVNYTFGGSGRITGSASLSKAGTGTLTIANTGGNDFSGSVIITDGTLRVGDGATSGAGTIGTGAVTVTSPGTLELNRPDDFTFSNAFSGTGTIAKTTANTVTIPAAVNFGGSVSLNAGTLRLNAGGTLSGALTGPGALTTNATLQLNGASANSNTGLTTVSAGVLQLAKSAGVDAVGGNITITGTAQLALLASEQIPNTATLTLLGSSADSLTTQSGETFANAVVNSSVAGAAGGQLILRANTTITGLATVQSGILGVASGNTGTVNAINITSVPGANAIVRIAGSGGPSTLNVGAGGITASGGEIQVKFNVNNQDAVMNLAGDFTATGNVAITNAGYEGANLNAINLSAGTHTFSIAAGTTTTVAPEVSGAGGLTKTGNGTLTLTAASASNYTGDTIVSQGTLSTTPAQIAGAVIVLGGATFGVNLASAGTTLAATSLDTVAGSTLVLGTAGSGNPFAPIISAGTLTINGATTLRVTGTALTPASGIPLISYTGSINGVGGFAGLTLSLPGRIGGVLVNNTGASRVDLDISGIEQIKWKGNVNGNWDIDPDGSAATGTTNWLTTLVGSPTRYYQGVIGIDTANFDDSATGVTNVNLTTTLSPNGVVVDNNSVNYTFSGTGRISGTTALSKTGTGTLTIANTGNNDYTGGTTIGVGSVLKLGNGVTNGAGSVAGTIGNDGTLILNRPDDVSFTNALTGSGTLQKDQGNTASFTAATTLFTPVVLNAGTLKFNAGGTLGGDISGAGQLEAGGGTLQINGATAKTNTGTTTVSAGLLQLNMAAGVNAVGGNVTITGTGQLALLAGEQIPNTATITFIGSSADAIPAPVGTETVQSVVANSSAGGAAGGQVILRNGFTALGMSVLNSGILGVSSGSTATLFGVNITAAPGSNALLRIAGNSAGSTLNIGAGGITASGGEIQVKFNTNNQDAVLNLGGNFTATGNVAITNAGYAGANLNVINLVGGPRTFDIAAATTTTVATNIGDGTLIKAGGGTLTLNGTLGSGALALTANAGTTNIARSQTLASLDIANGATVVIGALFAAPAPEFFGNDGGGFGDAGGLAGGAVQAVPEPGSASLLVMGAMGLLGLRRRARTVD